ncbi:MAG: T9SS type A sorting domain-containing protein [candidate division KSB1 bacterium]|nr:T9SS type A sorting domain-containing protein [candidate division KSB1 bacterium]
MKMLKKAIIGCMFCLLPFALFSAEVQVEPGDATLSAAIAAANDGDVLVLQDGGEYVETFLNSITIDKELTIKAKDNYTDRPVIKNHSVQTGSGGNRPAFFMLESQAHLTLTGLDLDGLEPDTAQYRAANYVVTFAPGAAVDAIKFDDCYVHDFCRFIVNGTDGMSGQFVMVDTLWINNSLVTHNAGFSFKVTTINYIYSKNSTFWNIGDKVFRYDNSTIANDPTVYINHVTIAYVAQKAIQMRPGHAENNMITIKNSLFYMINGDDYVFGNNPREPIQLRDGMNALVANCCFWEADQTAMGEQVANQDMFQDTLWIDPGFANVDPIGNGDFTLAEDSPILGQADDGMAIGDLRWDPTHTGVDSKPVSTPNGFTLKQNYPNPFNPTTTIEYTLTKADWTTIKVYDTMGRTVATLVHDLVPAGSHHITFDAGDLPSGVYVYTITSGALHAEKKMLVLK